MQITILRKNWPANAKLTERKSTRTMPIAVTSYPLDRVC